jgi:sarcosine oxidase delta subunit
LTLRHATGCQQFVKATKPLITDDLYASIPKRKVTKKLLKKNKK